MDTILLATDGLKSSAQALDFAIELAAEHDSNLVITHVVPTPIDVIDDLDDGELAELSAHERAAHGRATLEHAATEAAAHGVTATTSLLPGPVVAAILDASDRYDAALIVLGSRGHGAVASVLLRSVSLGVLRRSVRPVLIIRNPWSPVAEVNRPWLLHGRQAQDERHKTTSGSAHG